MTEKQKLVEKSIESDDELPESLPKVQRQKRQMSEKQLENLAKAREKAKVALNEKRARNKKLKEQEKKLKEMKLKEKEDRIQAEMQALQPKEANLPKPPPVKKKKKQKIVYYSSSDSSDEEEIVYKKRRKVKRGKVAAKGLSSNNGHIFRG